jgi:hypothetical protein
MTGAGRTEADRKAEARRQRLAKTLRENLQRRKAQQRGRAESADKTPERLPDGSH